MKRFLLGVVVGIAFAALPLGCTTTVGVLSGPTESQPAQQEEPERPGEDARDAVSRPQPANDQVKARWYRDFWNSCLREQGRVFGGAGACPRMVD